jgi:hypothetical protein
MPDVQILVAGEDVTGDVVFATAEFMSFVNGKPGEAYMRVRDLTSTRSFVAGSDWLVLVDGEAAWRGFVTSILRVYIAPALNVAEQGLQRFIDLRGADLNLLFERRVVANQSDPTIVAGTQFPPGTDDTVAITELLDDWLDLSSDDLDTTSGVNHVGDLDPEQDTRAWSGGWYWGNAMSSIAMIPAAIYYLRPEAGSPKGTLCYVDVDEPDAPFGLSDVPNGTTTKGYREMEIVRDGTSLANDVYAWGMGYGKQDPVFKHEVASVSQAAHGIWQSSVIAAGVYKQGTIDRIADSIVNGSPSSKRGAKADRPYVRLVTYDPGLLAGHVVNFTSEVWGFTDAIPVRQMRISFEAPNDPRYEVILSHEIDAPWSFIDQFWPQFNLPPTSGGSPGQTTTTVVPCDDNCGVADGFHRTVTTGWGNADSGETWTVYGDYIYSGNPDGVRVAAAGSVSFGTAVLEAETDTGGSLVTGDAVASVSGINVDPMSLELRYSVQCDDLAIVTSPPIGSSAFWGGFLVSDGDPGNGLQGATNYIQWSLVANTLGELSWRSRALLNGTSSSGSGAYVDPDTGDPVPATVDTDYEVRVRFVPASTPGFVTIEVKVWNPATMSEPVAWFSAGFDGSGTTMAQILITAVEARLQARPETDPLTRTSIYTFFDAYIACSDGPPVIDCAGGDEFERYEEDGWGSVPGGNEWSCDPSGDETIQAFQVDDIDGVAVIVGVGKQGLSGVDLNGGTATVEIDALESGQDVYVRFSPTVTTNDVPDEQVGWGDDQVFAVTHNILTVTLGSSEPWVQAAIVMTKSGGDEEGDPNIHHCSLIIRDSDLLQGGNADPSLSTLIKNLWYVLHIHFETGNTWAEIVGDPTMITDPIATAHTDLSSQVSIRSTGPYGFVTNDSDPATMPTTTGGGAGFYWMRIDYARWGCTTSGGGADGGDPDCVDGVKTVETLPANWTGFGCEIGTRTSAILYTTSQPFVPNGTLVWRAGIFQRRGDDYTEGADHRTLTFSYAVPPSDEVRICYVGEALQP